MDISVRSREKAFTMFVGWRDILFAKGRFTLMGVTVALITLLLVMLTGLTGGLGSQNTEALEKMGADRFVFFPASSGGQASFADSAVTAAHANEWSATGATAVPIGFTTGKIEGEGASNLTLIAAPAGSDLLQRTAALVQGAAPADGQVALPEAVAKELGAEIGDTVTFSGADLTVSGVTADTFYSHTNSRWTTTATWQAITHQREVEGAAAAVGTVLAVTGGSDYAATADATGAQALTTREAFAALPAYRSENGSLVTMQGFLYGISALVIVSFLTVWTIQRTRDIAVMRALGASHRFLTLDALAQAAVILAAGAGLGALVGAGLGALAVNAVPFQLSALTVAGPAAGIWALGMAGALIALRRVARVDPMIALGGN
ncbi:ABC transporter permease [Rothia nasisuis]|uniref:ABC transporter permease n=2 Tax=Rothia nasisuis TaxID=2109647 RepID=UPI001F46390B|nr:ABC transporter permease [Rothia nasisuis]